MSITELLHLANKQKILMATASSLQKNEALFQMAAALRRNSDTIINANSVDIEAASGTVTQVMLDRLSLDNGRINAMADGITALCDLPDPVGRIIERVIRDDGLKIEKVSVPMGVIAMIYESRPNVTSDAAALAVKSGNVCVLRGGKEAINSNKAIVRALKEGLRAAKLPEDAICLVEDTSRNSAAELMTAVGLVDLLIPRGGAGLIRACVENARVPCIQTGTGICHIYVDKAADIRMALSVIDNAKTSRPSVCNAAEVCLVDSAIAKDFLPLLKNRLVDTRAVKGLVPVKLLLDNTAEGLISGTPAGENDFDTEFLDYVMAIAVVDGVEDAVEHISRHSTGHSEVIITDDPVAADIFTSRVDSAAVYVNASTRFTDGGEFGLGCEMGISTQKLHARGPMGLRELTSYKFIINGNGNIR